MTVLPLDFDMRPDMTAPFCTPAPAPVRSDGLLTVRLAPPASEGIDPIEVLVDQELLVSFVAALARRTARLVRDGHARRVDPNPHDHPDHVACLRCAILGSTEHRTLAQALLALLAVENTDEQWNSRPNCKESQVISRLKKLAVSAEGFRQIYGDRWCAVMMTALRAESANLEQLALLTADHPNAVPPMSQYEADREVFVAAMAAYHLGMIVAPRVSLREPEGSHNLARTRIAARLATALFRIAAGETVEWVDHLPEPTL